MDHRQQAIETVAEKLRNTYDSYHQRSKSFELFMREFQVNPKEDDELLYEGHLFELTRLSSIMKGLSKALQILQDAQ